MQVTAQIGVLKPHSLGHSSPAITGRLYAHLLRPTGQAAAEKIVNAVPRRTMRHPWGHMGATTINGPEPGRANRAGHGPVQRWAVRDSNPEPAG